MGTKRDCSADVAEFLFSSRRKMSSLEATRVIMRRWPKATVDEIDRARAIATELLTADIAAESVFHRSMSKETGQPARPVATGHGPTQSKVDRIRILFSKLGLLKAD